jgi:hypothetical protein
MDGGSGSSGEARHFTKTPFSLNDEDLGLDD